MVLKTTDGHCGRACMTNGSEMLAAVNAWAAIENPSPSPAPSSTPSTSTGVAETSDSQIRLLDRVYAGSVLTGVFGPGAQPAVSQFVTSSLSQFGGPCDMYAKDFNSPTAPLGDCAEISQSQLSLIPNPTSGRFALTIRACEKILSQDAPVYFSAAQALGVPSISSLGYPSAADLSAAYQLFFLGKSPTPEVQAALQKIVDQAKASSYGGIEAWRFVLLALCGAPDWQVP
jgi:hypothetical protein